MTLPPVIPREAIPPSVILRGAKRSRRISFGMNSAQSAVAESKAQLFGFRYM